MKMNSLLCLCWLLTPIVCGIQVVLPYFKSKLHSVYNRERESRMQASLWGPGEERFDDADYFDGGGEPLLSTGTLNAETSVRTRLTKKIQKIIFACYPWLHASCEGFSFSYQLLYLLDATGFYSLGLHALGVHVCRATGWIILLEFQRYETMNVRDFMALHG